MNEELLTALERLEREKGISKDVLISAIESALASAAVKIIGDKDITKEDITVTMDKLTGEITVYKDDVEVKSDQFGRIAAQTAKQVIIQKIREAERDVITDKYFQMEGTIISGSVHRFDKGSIIVELDDAEAILPKSGQIPRERFRQGEMIRAYLVKVERKTGGVDIILSRSDPGFVKRLFELEVPEMSQGIVEIKSIAREAGERTKIAVYSKDEKIDSVGACVGMRGSRVKEIVRELSGERIDVVRWSDDIREYVSAAVSPVEIYSMEINREDKEIKLTVPKDQLALLIGKKGRNIRVASKLLGWEIKADAEEETADVPILEVAGLDEEVLNILQAAGCVNASQVVEIGIEKLLELEGIDEEAAEKMIAVCREALDRAEAARVEAETKAQDTEQAEQEEQTEEEEESEREEKPEDADNEEFPADEDEVRDEDEEPEDEAVDEEPDVEPEEETGEEKEKPQ